MQGLRAAASILSGSGRQESHTRVSAGLGPENHHLCVLESFMTTLI